MGYWDGRAIEFRCQVVCWSVSDFVVPVSLCMFPNCSQSANSVIYWYTMPTITFVQCSPRRSLVEDCAAPINLQ
jgi:hypothetical protein